LGQGIREIVRYQSMLAEVAITYHCVSEQCVIVGRKTSLRCIGSALTVRDVAIDNVLGLGVRARYLGHRSLRVGFVAAEQRPDRRIALIIAQALRQEYLVQGQRISARGAEGADEDLGVGPKRD
jgi:hypothetical protein